MNPRHLLLNVRCVGVEILDLEFPVNADLGKAKIGEFDVSLGREQNIVGLEIPMNDVVIMQVREGQGDLANVESRSGERKKVVFNKSPG